MLETLDYSVKMLGLECGIRKFWTSAGIAGLKRDHHELLWDQFISQ